MNDEHIRRIIEDSYDDSREDSVLSIAKDFYGKNLRSTAVLVWTGGIVFFALAAYSAVRFFGADDTKNQIMYAALFLGGVHGIGFMKVFAWDMVHRYSIKREIKRLELRIAELSEAVKTR